jgi:dTMP kinase
MAKGKFITIEGGEGTGKTTQIKLLEIFLKKKKIKFITTREPGGSKGAEKIRKLILKSNQNDWSPMTEALLHISARSDHLEKKIKPNLKKGIWVICDRFRDSTMAYQGYGNGLKLDVLEMLQESIFDKLNADLTIILDTLPNISLSRARKRKNGNQKYENMGINFHKKVRKGFIEIAKKNKKRCKLLSANDDRREINKKIIKIIEKQFKTKLL